MFVSSKVRVLTDETGAFTELPALLTPEGPLTPLLDYCLTRVHDRSPAWVTKVVRSVGIFLEYMAANPLEHDTHLLFQNFAQRLYSGTFDPQTGIDNSGLAWPVRSSADARRIITDLTFFFEWLRKKSPGAGQVNPRYAGDSFDSACDRAAYIHRRDAALLGHTWGANFSASSKGFAVRAQRSQHVYTSEPPAFPEDRLFDLLTSGFKVGNRYDYRGILLTLLCDAGFRESEPLHLYCEDVVPDPFNPKSALVRIHHPSQGFAPVGWRDVHGRERKANRATYLAERFGLLPRNQVYGKRAAGWKGGMHDGKYYKEAHWFPPEAGELFLTIWKKYLRQVAQVNRTHPFAFINLGTEHRGEMYTLSSFNKAHARACARIGLLVGKELGTTEHGHRHAYGRRLKNAGVEPSFLRRFMHHSSEESQKVYTNPTTAETRHALMRAAEKLNIAYPTRAFFAE
jgi:hypothetical protein